MLDSSACTCVHVVVKTLISLEISRDEDCYDNTIVINQRTGEVNMKQHHLLLADDKPKLTKAGKGTIQV
jgi:hypothetical protein